MSALDRASTAEDEAESAQATLLEAISNKQNFRMEAGAGAGKTYSLVYALRSILENRDDFLPRPDQRVACLTYTNVARDEIIERTDSSTAIFCQTLHGFLWEMIKPFQNQLVKLVLESERWADNLAASPDEAPISVDYEVGIRSLSDRVAKLHHDDIPQFAIQLFSLPKFRAILVDRFPVIFIDEYQDTPEGLVEGLMSGVGIDPKSPLIGLFGDHWQQIYEKTCGRVTHASFVPIGKHANFRSGHKIVGLLNGMRPDLTQAPAADAADGHVVVYHTNNWTGRRLDKHWKGQIPHDATHATLQWATVEARGRWQGPSHDSKTLLLTHTAIAKQLGYEQLAGAFKYNESFAKKEDVVVAYFLDIVEPAREAFAQNKAAALFEALGRSRPALKRPADKAGWVTLFERLDRLKSAGSVGDVLDLLLSQKLFSVPDRIQRRETDIAAAELSGEDLPRRLLEHLALRAVPYRELIALSQYLAEGSLYSTNHGVKGLEFDEVIVAIGRGWAMYDFGKMLNTFATAPSLDPKGQKAFERARNLFYVACSRAKRNLALIFVQELSTEAIALLGSWIGEHNVVAVSFDEAGLPQPTEQTS